MHTVLSITESAEVQRSEKAGFSPVSSTTRGRNSRRLACMASTTLPWKNIGATAVTGPQAQNPVEHSRKGRVGDRVRFQVQYEF